MNQSNNIPKEVRRIVSDRTKRQELFALISQGGGTLEFEGRILTIKPAFNGQALKRFNQLENAARLHTT